MNTLMALPLRWKSALAVRVAAVIQAIVMGSVCSVLKNVAFNRPGNFFRQSFFNAIGSTSLCIQLYYN